MASKMCTFFNAKAIIAEEQQLYHKNISGRISLSESERNIYIYIYIYIHTNAQARSFFIIMSIYMLILSSK